jgi:uncharacterized protein YbaA (DUF1428 family)
MLWIETYRELAALSAKAWREYGALASIEYQGDDAKPGVTTPFPQSVKLEKDDTVFVSLITCRSRQHRDEVNALVMQDPRVAGLDPKTMRSTVSECFGAASGLSSSPDEERGPKP